MDPPLSAPNDDVFYDAFHDCPFHHCSNNAENSPESSSSASGICDPDPPSPPLANTLRRRSTRHASPDRESAETVSESDLIDGSRTSFLSNQNLKNSKENENSPKKSDSNQEQVRSFPSPSVVTEERNEESTSSNDDGSGNFANSATEFRGSDSNFLEYVVGLMMWAIMYQINIFTFFIKFPMLFLFHGCMLFVNPFGTIRKGKSFMIGILGRVPSCVCDQGWFKDHSSLWNVAFRCGWGLLWSIYVCCILFALLVSSLVFSGFLVKCLVEKPFQMRQVLNFDYTKLSPVAYVPIISCSGVDGGQDPESDVAVSRWMNRRAIPAKQNVQVTVSLLVPESEYNTNLGVFQIRVDFLSSNGKAMGSSSQPCMLKFRSEPIRLITTFLKIVPLVTGYISETQTLNVKMKGSVEGNVPISCLRVTLEHRAEYPPGAGIPQIYDSSIYIESELPLFKRILWHWKISIFVWITMMTFVVELVFVLLCCWPLIIPRTSHRSGSARSNDNLQTPS